LQTLSCGDCRREEKEEWKERLRREEQEREEELQRQQQRLFEEASKEFY